MDIKPSDLPLLVTLDTLLEEGSVTLAARRLGISQPALSAQLARLRILFDDPLFVMSGRRLVPTTRALSLADPLNKAMRDLEDLLARQRDFDPTSAAITVRLGGTDYVHAVVSGGLYGALARQAPNVRLAMMPFDGDRLWFQLESGDVDAAIVTSFVRLDQAKGRFLFREDFALVQRRGHPRGRNTPTLDEFCALDHVLVSPEGGGFFGAVDEALERLGRRRTVAVSVPGFLPALGVVKRSDLVCVLPRRLISDADRDIELHDLPLDVRGFDLRLIWHPRRQNDPAHKWLRDQIAGFVRTGVTSAG